MAKRIIYYKCPFSCNKKYDREKLVRHVDSNHQDELPEGFSPLRYVFHYVNNKPITYHGICTECKGPTPWDENVGRYKRQCGKKECHDSYVRKFEENMVKKTGHKRVTDTQSGLEEMLKRRKISGKYTFQNGKQKEYVGSYEKKCLEFMDKVLNIDADDILAPGPTMEYIYDGKKHYYITDFFYQPYNLIIEVKDGGDHPNMRNMEEYRKKQIAKEEYIIKNTNYNYIRLTDNDFAQLMSVFADLKMQLIDHSNDRVIHVNETANIINENYLFNDKDILYNKDKFESGEINLCFIIGLSGSGKSTLGRNMSSDKVEHYEMDDLLNVADHFTMDNLKEYGDLIYSFFNGPGKKYYVGWDYLVQNNVPGSEYEDKLFVDFVNYAKKYAASHKSTKFVIEGVWIFEKSETGSYLFNPEEFKDYAFYIKGTSAIISSIRAMKRDSQDAGDKSEQRKAFLKQIGKFKNWKIRLSAEKDLERFRKYFINLMKKSVKEDATEDLINRTAVKYNQGKITDMLNKKNIIFDFGDVLTNYREEDAIKGITDVPAEAIVSIVAAFHKYWKDDKPEDKSYEEEMIDAKEYVPDEYKEYSDRMYEELHEYSGKFDYTDKMLSELNRLGYNLYYLSNWSKGSWLHMVETGKFDFMKFFKGGIASWQTGTKKPDRRIYEMLLDKYGLKAEECIFFDDKEKNIEAAREVGIYGIKWEPGMDKEVIKYAKMGADRREEETFNEFMNALTSGFFPGYKDCDSYIVMSDYMQNNVFADCGHNFFAITDDPAMHHLLYVNNEGVLCYDSLEDFDKTYPNLADSLSVFALEVPASGIKDALARYIGKELSREDMYYSVFKEHLYSIDQARFSKKVLGEVNNELYDFNAIYEMTKGTLIYGKEDMLPRGNHEFYNIRNGKTYVQSELNSNFFTEANSPKSKMFMEQIICGGMINNG